VADDLPGRILCFDADLLGKLLHERRIEIRSVGDLIAIS
jgi:hypothetical protein